MSGPRRRLFIIVTAAILWVPAVAFGISALWRYSTTPGRPASPPLHWPAHVPMELAKGRATLMIFAHPKCPCSAATVGELAIIMAHAQKKVDARVFFYAPSTESTEWIRTDLWNAAKAIPGVQVFEDRDATAARDFGALTSGQSLLYSADGRLLFEGGITAFRGHSGDNAGRSAILAILQGDKQTWDRGPVTTPVFGCSLQGE
jgi:hypothetical protein